MTTREDEMRAPARAIAEKIAADARMRLICMKPEYDTIDLGESLILNALTALSSERDGLVELLRRIEPHLDAIVCYASTMGEHEPNRIAFDVRAALTGVKGG